VHQSGQGFGSALVRFRDLSAKIAEALLHGGLVEALGGPPTPGIGFGIGIERVLGTCDAEGVLPTEDPALDAFVVDTTGGAAARDLVAGLRRAGLSADRAFDQKSMKAQLKVANRAGARVALLVGPHEHSAGTVSLKDMRTGLDDAEQVEVPLDEAIGRVVTLLADRELRPDRDASGGAR